LQLRIKDTDLNQHTIIVRNGKGGEDRIVMLLIVLEPALKEQFCRAEMLRRPNANSGLVACNCPTPSNASTSASTPFGVGAGNFRCPVIPAIHERVSGATTTLTTRHFSAPSSWLCNVNRSCALPPRTPCATPLQHTFSQAGAAICKIQKLLGHSCISTTMLSSHVIKASDGAIRSPLGALVPT